MTLQEEKQQLEDIIATGDLSLEERFEFEDRLLQIKIKTGEVAVCDPNDLEHCENCSG